MVRNIRHVHPFYQALQGWANHRIHGHIANRKGGKARAGAAVLLSVSNQKMGDASVGIQEFP